MLNRTGFPFMCRCAILGLCLGYGNRVMAVESNVAFRVETQVYIAIEQEPVAHNLTIFLGDRVYDFLLGNALQVTILDKPARRVTLLDRERRAKCHLGQETMLKITEEIQKRGHHLDPLVQFAASPSFRHRFDPVNGDLTLQSDLIVYHVKTVRPKIPAMVRQYLEFADWCAMLNSVTASSLPAAARMDLNRQLVRQQLLPREIRRRLVPLNQTVTSRHHFQVKLSDTDLLRIANAKRWSKEFQLVRWESFRPPPLARQSGDQ